jgi:K+-transporting ATPase c subunit
LGFPLAFMAKSGSQYDSKGVTMKRKRNRQIGGLAAGSILLLLVAIAAFASRGSAAGQAAPVNTSPPTVSGTAEVGKQLTGRRGEWSGNPTDYNFFWTRCDRNGGSCANISGATRATYTLTSADVGNTVRFKVEAVNADGRTFASSVPTAVVKAAAAPPPPPAPTGCAANAPLQVAKIGAPERLDLSQYTISPSIVGRSTQSVTVRFLVTCKGKPVQGALVYAAAVPFNQFTVPTEQPTGADGWAQLTMTQLSGYPAARRQQLLVVFGRARKPGENLLGGISTRRLVSFPVDLRR